MPVYVDNMMMEAEVPNGNRVVRGKWSHLTADTEEELHEFAKRLGLRREWFQPEKVAGDTPRNRAHGVVGKVLRPGHYDVVQSKRLLAIKLGAVAVRWGCEPWREKQRRTLDAALDAAAESSGDTRPVDPGEAVEV